MRTLLLCTVLTAIFATPATGTLIAHWDINSTDGFSDIANGHDPIAYQNVDPTCGGDLAEDRFGDECGAIYFGGPTSAVGGSTGPTSYVRVANDAALTPDSFKLEFWFKSSGGVDGTHMLVLNYIDAAPANETGHQVSLFYYGDVAIEVGQINMTLAGIDAADDEWHHLRTVYRADTLTARVYLDEVKVAEKTGLPGDYAPVLNNDWYFGVSLGSPNDPHHNFVGYLDDIRLYAIPEPSTALMIGFGLTALALRRRLAA